MKSMRKIALFIILAIMICTLCCVNVSANTASNTDVGVYRLNLLLAYGGGTDRSLDRQKMNSMSFVDMEELMIATLNDDGIYLRVRDSNTNAYATAVGHLFYYDSWWRPNYLSGYGIEYNYYYVKGQTPSNSVYSAVVDAYWRP